jgi:hypothetical protein
VELKGWLDMEDRLHQARLAKEAMGLAYFGGG